MKETVLELNGIVKEFPGVRALNKVDFNVYENEIVGLVGENGAGKSTLMKILIGLYKIDQGSMKVRGEEVRLTDPRAAIKKGIGMVFQEQSLIPNLTVAENMFLCHENQFKTFGIISTRKIYREARTQLSSCGFDIDPKALVSDISSAQRQLVEIARLLWLSGLYEVPNPILILDEPTTVLVQSEVDQLFNQLRCLENKVSIIFISHRLEEVIEIADRIVILKDGEHVCDLESGKTDISTIENHMVGHELAKDHYKETEQIEPKNEILLKVEGLEKRGSFQPIHFQVKKGEILCFGGVIGSGKEEIAKCIAGTEKVDKGKIIVSGREIQIKSPRDAITAEIGYVPIDRRDEGLALQLDVMSNITLVTLKKLLRGGVLFPRDEKTFAEYWVNQLTIRTPSLKTFVGNLSGGNQQKVVLAKWLASKVKILILDHPTRGVDVGAKEQIYSLIRHLAKEGLAIILMSDTMEEDIGLCNRMITLKDGAVTGEILCPADKKPVPVDIIGYMV